ncbi:Adenosyl cobinamide kinase/adenosyl cobinamide phosphate guanylyltransferase [Rubrobacter radiotolerans]|uniref:Adenosylcobinamide kinase n=1 Tax=Rubrobacter radiotolerans TaxID=42256 RepID=A0A023X1C9_RUBRA|nr:bifunctional adenosylcobinamide kinase/adenosylcobinamide-phosphate guanylyltransferase [Rubrobacter radiotolerans]AHY46113.1 Adenosyl cobinamide kinase/adenosyl cobinamide phosphate guanylyltransferase [Rubrobacter radiotolerans]MDX5893523.1 bifunctional adenosylcobinamide kinase/adenosylcobinamide-phosphate guanylyltransferase [Rubrobacter radiotolerans]
MSLFFVTGGARSGKSRYAERLAGRLAGGSRPVLYVATAEPLDGEMRERVLRHRQRRPEDWRTVEARRSVGAALRDALAGDRSRAVVLLDCLSLLVSNVLLDVAGELGELSESGPELERRAGREVVLEVEALLGATAGTDLVVVSNEVGWSVVPPYRLGRVYRDLLGEANAQVAARSEAACLLVAGLPVVLRGGDEVTGDCGTDGA